jgi:hypothetical protein
MLDAGDRAAVGDAVGPAGGGQVIAAEGVT